MENSELPLIFSASTELQISDDRSYFLLKTASNSLFNVDSRVRVN